MPFFAHFDLKMEFQSKGAEFSSFLGMAGKMDCIFWRKSFSCNREKMFIKKRLQNTVENGWNGLTFTRYVHCGHPGPSTRWGWGGQLHTRHKANPIPTPATLKTLRSLAPQRFPQHPVHIVSKRCRCWLSKRFSECLHIFHKQHYW